MLPESKKTDLDQRLGALTMPESTGWLQSAREAARERLSVSGLPARRDEYWRYTDPKAFVQAAPGVVATENTTEVFADLEAFVITVENGVVSFTGDAPAGLEISTLASVATTDIHWAREVYGALEAAGSQPVVRPLASLNTAYAQDGVLIRATAPVETPVVIRYAPGEDPILHHVIRVTANASMTLLEVGTPGGRGNTVAEVEVADGGAFHHIRVQGPDDARHANTHTFAALGEASTIKSFTLSANGALTRNEAVITLTGDDAIAHVAGAAFGKGDFHHDDTVFVTHDAERCESRQVFKKVLRDGATGVFQGKILVKEGAQKTDGYQISQSLLLDDDSVFLAKPELEIYADDVACSHGSTTGAIDETALFYLRSRGVPKRVATDLLVLSFLAEALDEIEDDDLRERVSDYLADWLAQQ
ncbi:Fe-S cluster assembly protein SufD [Jannaschia pagri]|uniref:Fe-S cluster assembly protein SufD n=2 Tax=Roseobacteraceae TaxID=2854170 RepID=A0ABQ4NNT4_9RHOB|nr:Fe-S cluster assembly protein SufD [Jannaschia sp. AI_61]GIT96073.1 Fe-S cluster assembly protein SufD [Jannaschia sp. AI_62]